MADVVESLEVGCAGGNPPRDVGAVLFFLNLGRVEGFGFEGRGRRAKREPDDKKMALHPGLAFKVLSCFVGMT